MTMHTENTTHNIKIPDNKEYLKQHFSHCFNKNGELDFDKLKQELSQNNDINFASESYTMDWLGKSYARLLASDAARTLLSEDEDFNQQAENKNSENMLIKGDNLEVLKHLRHAYYKKVKMIYIDPPYNTGGDGFIYQDDRKFTIESLVKLAGIDEDRAKRILTFTQSNSNSHSAWLTFIYPRLYIAKQLLKDDGVIFVSIDDNEVAQLRLLMDEIFGEENFQYHLSVVNSLNGNDNSSGMMETQESCLIYAKEKDKFEIGVLPIDEHEELGKWQEDELGFWKEGGSLKATGEESNKENRENLFFPVCINEKTLSFSLTQDRDHTFKLLPVSEGREKRWTWGKEKFLKDKNEVIIKKVKDSFSLYKKQRPALGDLPSKRGKTTFYKPQYSTSHSNADIKKLFRSSFFSYTKSTTLIKDFINLGIVSNNKDDLILDFFAGSGTTADAVMQLNAEDDGNRKFILVQIAEEIDKKKSKTAYDFVKNELGVSEPTIFEITRERIIRSAKKIQDVNTNSKDKKDLSKQDFGFKIFETIPNHEGVWENYEFLSAEHDPDTVLFNESNLQACDLKNLLTTWKTKDNIPLTQNLQSIDLNGYCAYYEDKTLYLVGAGFTIKNLISLLEKIDADADFNPDTIIAFGYHFESKVLREIAENITSYNNKKQTEFAFITRY